MIDESAFDKLVGLEKMPQPVRAPKGWEPGTVWNGTVGEVTTSTFTEPISPDAEVWGEILKERGLDPAKFEIVGDSIRWCSYDGWKRDEPGGDAYSTTCYSYKATIRLRKDAETSVDLEELYKEARKAKPKVRHETGDSTLVVALSDWQIGNGDAGGITTQISALAALPQQIVDRLKQLRKAGHKIEKVVLAGLGDLGEGTCGFYPSQQFTTQLDRRQQVRVVRRALKDIVMTVADATTEVLVTAVGGNHGENRNGGKRYTTYGDNDDVAVFEQVMEIVAESTYENIQFLIPNDELGIAIEAHGHIIGFTHGHLPTPQKNAAQCIWDWWTKQAMGRYYEGIADANILVSGHFHHFNCKQQEGRTVFVCPSLTQVGDWWGNANGVRTQPGTLTFVINETGWTDLHIIPSAQPTP